MQRLDRGWSAFFTPVSIPAKKKKWEIINTYFLA
jgi:hypothetical protein